jgi:hypothetical protein
MIGAIFEFLNGIATLIGWLAMVGGGLWLVSKWLESRNAERAFKVDAAKRLKFEEYLEREKPEAFKRYIELTREHCRHPEWHWHGIAQEAGIPSAEILRNS